MLKNYCLVAWRNLMKNKGYAAINIIGLGLGMAITLLIGLWIIDEVNYDHFYPGHERVAQVMIVQQPKSLEKYVGETVAAAIDSPLSAYHDLFSRTAMVSWPTDMLIAAGEKRLSEQGIWAQYTFPEIFGFKMLAGTAASLKDPSTVLLAHNTAVALFGNADPINQTIRLQQNKQDFRVGGVYEDQPDNTTFHYVQMVFSWENKQIPWYHSNDWQNHNTRMFVQLTDRITAAQATTRVRGLPTPHIKNYQEELMIYPFDRAYLHGEFKNGIPEGGKIQYVNMFGIVGVFVLLLACINFMNLSTARSEQRAREVGIRKTVGSLRGQLVGQFLGESVMMALFALVVALMLVQLSLSWFNVISAKAITIPWASPLFWLIAIGLTLFVGLIAGSYPAFYLSSFNPVKVLKGTFKAGRGASLPRQVLVVVQFTVSLALIIGTIVVFRQIQVSKDRPVGYSRDGLVMVNINSDELADHYNQLRQDVLATGVAENMAESSFGPTGFWENNNPEWDGQTAEQKSLAFQDVNITADFGKTIGWTLLQGRDLKQYPYDSSSVLLNEEAVRAAGFKHPIGQIITILGKPRTVVGVVENMLTNSPYEKIRPAIFLGEGWMGKVIIRVKPGVPMRTALARLEPVFRQHNPGSPFLYDFVDDIYAKKFETETRIGQLSGVFASLAIFISCLGLFGLASFIAEQRTKEIGVRKVLGAGVFNLWGLLSKDFVKLMLLSMLIAMPLAYWLMNEWLLNYPLHTTITWWVFAVSGAGMLLITLLTVSWQSVKAAMMSPVRSLRSE